MLYNKDGYKPMKLHINPNMANNANYQCSSFGPNFGGDNDIHILSQMPSAWKSPTLVVVIPTGTTHFRLLEQ